MEQGAPVNASGANFDPSILNFNRRVALIALSGVRCIIRVRLDQQHDQTDERWITCINTSRTRPNLTL